MAKKVALTKQLVACIKEQRCSCGRYPYEECQRISEVPCLRECHGGKRKPTLRYVYP